MYCQKKTRLTSTNIDPMKRRKNENKSLDPLALVSKGNSLM